LEAEAIRQAKETEVLEEIDKQAHVHFKVSLFGEIWEIQDLALPTMYRKSFPKTNFGEGSAVSVMSKMF
jgi:hypothetical protein